MTQRYISAQELSEGAIINVMKLPPIDKTSQTQARSRRKLAYCKIMGRVYYKPEWIQEYLDKNTVKAAG